MAKKISNTNSSFIETLIQQRSTIFAVAEKRDGIEQDFTREEQTRVEALNSVIAHSAAHTLADARAQLALAVEYADLHQHNVAGATESDSMCAALLSAQSLFARQRTRQHGRGRSKANHSLNTTFKEPRHENPTAHIGLAGAFVISSILDGSWKPPVIRKV